MPLQELLKPCTGFFLCALVGMGGMNNHVKTYRKKQGLTQTDLANRAGLNIRQIQKIENGEAKTENITLKTMKAIAQALNVKIDDLIS